MLLRSRSGFKPSQWGLEPGGDAVLSDGLVGAWLFNDHGGYVPNLADRFGTVSAGSLSSASNIAIANDSNEQYYLSCSGSGTERCDLGSSSSQHPIACTRTNYLTVIAKVYRVPSAVSAFPRVIDRSNAASGGGGWAFYVDEGGTALRLALSGTDFTSGVYTNFDSRWAVIGARRYNDFTLGNQYDAFQDLAENGDPRFLTGGNCASTPGTTTVNAAIGNWNHTTGRNWEGRIAWVLLWDRGLAQSEIRAVYRNPFSVFDVAKLPFVEKVVAAASLRRSFGIII